MYMYVYIYIHRCVYMYMYTCMYSTSASMLLSARDLMPICHAPKTNLGNFTPSQPPQERS